MRRENRLTANEWTLSSSSRVHWSRIQKPLREYLRRIEQRAAGMLRGLRPTAIPDITARARTVFRLVEGAPRAYEADGQTLRVGKDGIMPMTLDEWVDQQVADAPHLFESNAGGGAGGAGGDGEEPGVSGVPDAQDEVVELCGGAAHCAAHAGRR